MIQVSPFTLKLHHALQTARGELSRRDGVLITVTSPSGHVGQGEATPMPGWSRETQGEVLGQLIAVAANTKILPASSAELLAWLQELRLVPSAAFGLGTALLDAAAHAQGRPLAKMLARRPRSMVPLAHLVEGVDDAFGVTMLGAETIKLKVGLGDIDAEVAMVSAIRDAVGPEVGIRLDANGAWGETEAGEAILRLAPLNIECIEEPVRDKDLSAMARLRGMGIPIAADESAQTAADVERIIAREAADIVVIKPMLLGAPQQTLTIADRVGQAGLQCFLTTTLDGAIARRAILHLCAAVTGQHLRPCGLVTGRFLASDIAPSPALSGSHAELGSAPGLGLVRG